MQEIPVYDLDGVQVVALAQYDSDVYLTIRDPRITEAYNVHYFNQLSELAFVTRTSYGDGVLTTKVPNDLLYEPYTITGYVDAARDREVEDVDSLDGASGQKTSVRESRRLYGFRIAVRKMPRPGDWIHRESDDYITLEEVLDECREFADEAGKSAEAAARSEENARLSEENAAESERNAGVSERNAAESERNAKRSEENAKSSEENAAKSKADAMRDAIAAYNSALMSKSYAVGESGWLANEEWERIITDSKEYVELEQREGEETDNAKSYCERAQLAMLAATLSQDNAQKAQHAALASQDAAKKSAEDAESSKKAAAGSEANAKESQDAAGKSAKEAHRSEVSAGNYESLSKSYAVGGTGRRAYEVVDNSKYYYEQAKQISQGLGGALLPMGTKTFEELSSQTKQAGYMYNISDEFTSTADFADGGNVKYPAGTNVYYTGDGKWDCLAGSLVSGVKGNAEEAYRVGEVNLTPENIGAESKEDAEKLEERVALLEMMIFTGEAVTDLVTDDGEPIATDDGEQVWAWWPIRGRI